MLVSPNPSRGGTVSVRVQVPETSDLHVEMFDALGRRVRELWSGPAVGEQTISADVSDLPPGVYTVVASVGEQRRVGRFTVVR